VALFLVACGDEPKDAHTPLGYSALPDDGRETRLDSGEGEPVAETGEDGPEDEIEETPQDDPGEQPFDEPEEEPEDEPEDEPTAETPPLLGFIGSPCESVSDCSYDGATCLSPVRGYPGGMCSSDCERFCPDAEGYPTTFCVDSVGVSRPVCHSRCDFASYPGRGCRSDYVCRIQPRSGEADVEYGTCIPDDGSEPDGMISDCLQYLIDRGINFEMTTYADRHPEGRSDRTCSLEDPVRLHSPINGINFRYHYDDPGSFRSMLVACPLAQAIVDMTDVLHTYDVTEVLHVGTTVCRMISGTDSISQHGLGLAIDLSGFFDDDAVFSGVYEHWEDGDDSPESYEGSFLYDFVHDLYDLWVFNVILTPEFNAAHDNHFHVDMTEGSHYLRLLDENAGPYFGPNVDGE
jgi:hypothetical protein